MGKSSKKYGAKQPQSFSLYVLQGEALIYPRGTITPTRSPYCVVGTPVKLTREVLKAWLLQSIGPLVGPDAVMELSRLFEEDMAQQEAKFDKFLDRAIAFREETGPTG